MSVNTKMTAIADEIRELSGTTEAMGLDAMVTNLGEANNEIGSQADLISQIASALEGKASGGSAEPPMLQNKTVTPTTNVQNVTADSGYDGLDTVTVNAIPNTYVEPIFTKVATTYTPTTTNQTIDAGTYCSGIQTIKGDSNLIAENIKSGISIFGVSGTAEVGGGSSSAESNSTCTVTFNNSDLSNDCHIVAIIATILENGVYKSYFYEGGWGEFDIPNHTISNVVCGTTITLFVQLGYRAPLYIEIDGSATFDGSYFYMDSYNLYLTGLTAPSVANENCTIYYAYEP